ncbi:hypothetical protein ABK040_007261 [Willaertia magna]
MSKKLDYSQLPSPLFLVRHGEKATQPEKLNNFNEFKLKPYFADPLLTERGIQLSKYLGKYIYFNYINNNENNNTQKNINFTIFSSPYKRCLQTTQYLMEQILELNNSTNNNLTNNSANNNLNIKFTIYIEYGLMEWFGTKRTWTLEYMPLSLNEIKENYPFIAKYLNNNLIINKEEIINEINYNNHNNEMNNEKIVELVDSENYIERFTVKYPKETMNDLIRRVNGVLYHVSKVMKIKNDKNEELNFPLIVTHAATLVRIVELLLGLSHKVSVNNEIVNNNNESSNNESVNSVVERIIVNAMVCGLTELRRKEVNNTSSLDSNNNNTDNDTANNNNNKNGENGSVVEMKGSAVTVVKDGCNNNNDCCWEMLTNSDISFLVKEETIVNNLCASSDNDINNAKQLYKNFYNCSSTHFYNRD